MSEITVDGHFKVNGIMSAEAMNIGDANGASNGDLKIRGSLILDKQTGWTPALKLKDTSGNVKATFGIDGVWAESLTATSSLHSKGDAQIDGKITVNSADSTFAGPVYINGGKWDLAAINPTDPSQGGLYVRWIGNTMVSPNIPGGPVETVTGFTEREHYFSSSGLNPVISLYTTHSIYSANVVAASDRRIKKDIEPVPDDAALEILRKLDPKYYHYIDTVQRGQQRTIGFIAQDVKEVLPEAVTILKDFIPNEMRLVDVIWSDDGSVMRLMDPVSPGVYRFFASKESDGSDETMYEFETLDGMTFETPGKFAYVFMYGKQVNDFHAIDKQKNFCYIVCRRTTIG